MTTLPAPNLRVEIDQESGPLLLLFVREQAACRWAALTLSTILQEFPEVRLLRVDEQHHPQLCARFAVPRVPHLSFVQAGKARAGLTGVYTAGYLRRWLRVQLAHT